MKRRIDSAKASPHEISEYIQLCHDIDRDTGAARTAMHTYEEIAYSRGQRHDVGSASFYRPFTPRGAAHWVEEIFNADWTDPSNPVRDGTSTTAAPEIAEAITPFYGSLYGQKTIDPACAEKCWATLRTGNRVPPPTAEMCSKPISDDDATSTCNVLPTGKSPGPDRIPNKFYKVFSKKVGPIVAAVVNESRNCGCFPEGFSDGLIALLYKKKDRDDPRNYRPITLLNGDYKIMMRVLAARMNIAVVQFVSSCQTGFVPDALLAENVMLLKLIQAWIENEDEDAYFVFLDMEKAFDRCSWEFLVQAMKEVGFDDGFISYITLAYSRLPHPRTDKYTPTGTSALPLRSARASRRAAPSRRCFFSSSQNLSLG